jgi:predicted  nucleic acid-binding Zn-ribbon protein
LNNKLQKVIAEIEKVKAKISAQQIHLKELEQQKTELENTEIVGMVRGLDVAPEELAAFIKAFRSSTAGTPDFMEKEDEENEHE